MQTSRRLFAALAPLTVSLISIALLVGCSFSPRPSGGPLPDAAPLVKESAAATKNLKSAHLVLTVTGKIPGLSLKSLTGDLTTQPSTAAKGKASLSLLGRDIDADFTVIDGDLYTNALNPGSDAQTDVGPASDIYDPSQILSPDVGLANVLANFTPTKAEGRDTIGGQTAVRISGTVTADAVNKIAPPFGAKDAVPAVAWVQESGDHQLVQISLQQSPGNTVQMTLSNWGQPVQVSKPAAG